MDNEKIPDGIRVSLNLLERELAPSLFVVTFLISCGGFYLGGLLMMLSCLAAGVILLLAYMKSNAGMVAGGRIWLFVSTVILFFILLGDYHIFEDTTLPQVIERHMTDDAILRHGADDTDISNMNRTFLNNP